MSTTINVAKNSQAAIARLERLGAIVRKYGPAIALALMIVVATLSSDRFLQVQNLLNVLRQISIVGVLGLGMTFVIITAGIDLSVGAILSVVVVYGADAVQTQGVFIGIVVALGMGALLGLINGIGITLGKVQPFIMTLGMLAMAKGIALLYTQGTPIVITNQTFLALGNGRVLGIPNPILVFLSLVVVTWFVLRHTVFGRSVYAVGANEEAARLSGISVGRVKTTVYVISGLMAGVAGVLYASQLGVGSPVSGDGYELAAIAATVVGGTSLFGGAGGVGGTFIGAALLGVLSNFLNLTGVSPYAQNLFRGALIIAAALLQRKSARGL
ncbi:ABC transporter permease [Aeromicrobium sp.]|uniref:ABC transporter permease n=1 Tax=Aeromicrobium sp. TaxID=1871063 RepID=UPI00199D63AA|nr:ABC transporter permease [Aeromicrobium sp.]MBC7633609.1 ABC transporter permease [Aeromicrobium sp.]